jgi:hypothetical protein
MSTAAQGKPSELGDWFARLKSEIDLHELAERLGLKRQGSHGNYHSPHHEDRQASLSIYDHGRSWKDWSGDAGGSCIDLVRYCQPGISTPLDAARLLGQWFGLPQPTPARAGSAPVRKSTVEYIADRCLAQPELATDYLAGRGIDTAVIQRAIQCRTLGWNHWASAKVPAGEVGHGGDAAAFIVRQAGRVVAIDMRYADPPLNGGVKTQCQGEKDSHYWTSDPARLKRAHTVIVVESPINALSVECRAGHPWHR